MTVASHRGVEIQLDPLDGYEFAINGIDFKADEPWSLSATKALIDDALLETFEHRGIKVRPSDDWGFIEFEVHGAPIKLAAPSAKMRCELAIAIIDTLKSN